MKSKYGYMYVPFDYSGFIYYNGKAEPQTIQSVKQLIETEGIKTFVNVGAGYGEYILLARSLKADVIAFEPLEEFCKIINFNINLNQMSARVYQMALFSKEGSVKFRTPKDVATSSFINGFGRTVSTRQTKMRTVKTAIFDKLDLNVKMPALFLIDVEGAEIEVLAGMKETVERCKPIIILETDNNKIHRVLNVLKNYKCAEAYDIAPTFSNFLLKKQI